MANVVDITLELGAQEGTSSFVSTWLKGPGETVQAHEPVAELETDKVVVEVAAPVAGIIAEIVKQEGEEVRPGDVVGRIEARSNGQVAVPVTTSDAPRSEKAGAGAKRLKLSPAVRRLVKEHRLDPGAISGSGKGGRVTVRDVERFLRSSAVERTEQQTAAPAAPAAAKRAPAPELPAPAGGVPSHFVPHDSMRTRIADHMVRSLLHTAPHVTSIFEADMTAVMKHRAAHKEQFARQGVNLTYSAYFICACSQALQHVPEVNSRFHDDRLEVYDDINIGVGTALEDKGLVVPVLHRAQTHNLLGVAAKLQDLTTRARDGKLTPADVQNGTFTISNHGVSGSLIAAPIIINQPQSAILGIGKLEKRVVVKEVEGQDTIQIRPMCYVTLSVDHRVLDGYQTNRFLSKLIELLENWE